MLEIQNYLRLGTLGDDSIDGGALEQRLRENYATIMNKSTNNVNITNDYIFIQTEETGTKAVLKYMHN